MDDVPPSGVAGERREAVADELENMGAGVRFADISRWPGHGLANRYKDRWIDGLDGCMHGLGWMVEWMNWMDGIGLDWTDLDWIGSV